MSDPDKKDRPDPIEDVRKGLGLLFRAAKSAVDSLPKGKFEDVVLSGAREVGRAIENVTETLEHQLFKREGKQETDAAKEAAPKDGEATKDAGKDAPKDEAPKAETEEPKGTRVE